MKAKYYEHMRYKVESETERDKEYIVDLLEKRCTCVDFDIRVAAKREKDECKHFSPAYEQFGRDLAEQIRVEQGQKPPRHD